MAYIVLTYPLDEKPNIIDSFYRKLQKSARAKIIRQLRYLEEYGLSRVVINLKKLHGYEFWEVRILGKENIRIFVWGVGDYIFLLHIFMKKQQTTKLSDLLLAKTRLTEIKHQINYR